jgi:hypothetical protein
MSTKTYRVIGAVLLLGVIGLLIWAVQAGGSNTMQTYRRAEGVWEISYPSNFQIGPLPGGDARVSEDGIWISNFGQPPVDQSAVTPSVTHVPRGVLVEVSQIFGPIPYFPDHPDSTFPLSVADLRAAPVSSEGAWKQWNVIANGEPYSITARLGPDASAQDQQAARDIVSSFQVLPLRDGTWTGQHMRFAVLGPPDSYPVASATRYDASNLNLPHNQTYIPFYLVHVPQGFYAVSWPRGDNPGSYMHCDVTFDPAAREFTCPNGARWALDGSVVAKPTPSDYPQPLSIDLVRISQDGHVLVSPFAEMPDTSLDLRMTGS